MANTVLFSTDGGRIERPEKPFVLVDREDGGALIVMPPRPVWDRTELSAKELASFSLLVAATARAMLDVLPQLEGGCINYWDAGNWALNDAAEPPGPKTAARHRNMHLHLLGRSRTAKSPAWRWGESPVFPTFDGRLTWGAHHEPLSYDECHHIVATVEMLLAARYRLGG
jgi:hypothetical protein